MSAPQAPSPSNVFSVALFTLMVAAIATVGFSVMGEFGLVTSCFLGGGIGVVAGIVLGILLRRPSPTPADKPVGRAPRSSEGRSGPVVPADDAGGAPATTLGAVTSGGAASGGVGRPATAAARSPLDPAELPVAGAGGPLEAPSTSGGSDGGGTTTSAAPRVSAVPEGGAETPQEGSKPPALSEPRGEADDLTAIRGIGQALQDKLHGLGIYHYEQIAAWTPAEVAWIDRNLEGFTGRASRDEWVHQARALVPNEGDELG